MSAIFDGARWRAWLRPVPEHTNAWVPGRTIGGTALIIGPLVWFAGLLLRHLAVTTADFTPARRAWFDRQTFDAPEQLAAYTQHPGLVTAGYALFAGGAILLFPAIMTFSRIVAARSPRLAFWGGTVFVAALFARLYFAGVDRTAFQLVDELGLKQATRVVLDSYVDLSYGLWRIPVTVSVGTTLGGLLLAVGAYRARVLDPVRCVLLVLPGIGMGVLKESDLLTGVLIGAVPCVVLVPYGIGVLRGRVAALHTDPDGAARATPAAPGGPEPAR